MYLLKKEKNDLLESDIIIYSNQTEELIKEEVKKHLEHSKENQCFICDTQGKYLGIITLGDYKRAVREGKHATIKINKNSKVIFEDENIESRIQDIKATNFKISLFPILDKNKKLLYAYKTLDFDKEELPNLLVEIYRKDREYGISAFQRYFAKQPKNFKFAIWGVNKFSMELAEEISNLKIDNFSGIYDTKESLHYNTYEIIKFTNYQTSPIVASELTDSNLEEMDLILVSDFSSLKLLETKKEVGKQTRMFIGYFLKEVLLESANFYIEKKKKELEKKDVKLTAIHIPTFEQMGCTGNEWVFKDHIDPIKKCRREEEEEKLEECFKEKNSKPQIIRKGSYRCFSDFSSKYINYINGERLTKGQPDDWDNTIYLFGNCVASSVLAEDSDTVASQLQSMINKNILNKRWRVISYGSDGDLDPKYSLRWIEDINWKPGDMAFLIGTVTDFSESDDCLKEEFFALYQKKNFIFDNMPAHCNYDGYELTANTLYKRFVKEWAEQVKSNKTLSKGGQSKNEVKTKDVSILLDENEMLKDFCNSLLQYKKAGIKGRIGSIVMNCNPFTLGHRYLIEQAIKEVEILYIFVVEEDKSIFKFKDRIELVKAGTKDLDGVIVLPSGKYIISAVTFPTYFQKEHITTLDNSMDASADLDIFGQYIAKTLDITIRFVGEEPLDIVTNMYNRQMKDILPQYGIEVIIIKRKEKGDMVISASRVRAHLKEKEFEKISELVPETTLEYLKNRNLEEDIAKSYKKWEKNII